jgi:hypothetical protein
MTVGASDIATLRSKWLIACSNGLGPEMLAYCRLLEHPDVAWRDLIEGLDRPEIVAEQAWLRLRNESQKLQPAGVERRDREFWQLLLESRQIDLDAPFSRNGRAPRSPGPSGPIVAILEDNAGRCAIMEECLRHVLPAPTAVFFDSAHEMVDWLREHQAEVSLISLDFDLPITRTDEGDLIDYGTGSIVAEYLESVPPTCPVIVHSSNVLGATKMMEGLQRSGWPVVRVYPSDDTAWIDGPWSDEICNYAKRGLLDVASA